MSDLTQAPNAQSLPRYAFIHRLLHWVIAILVLLALAFGATIGYYEFTGLRDTFGIAITNFIYTTHKTLGILILGLMVLRLLTRFSFGKPRYATPLPAAQRVASETVHAAFYVLLLVMAVLGWLATGSGGFPVSLFHIELPAMIGRNDELSKTLFLWHQYVGYALATLIVLHIVGALYHWRVRRDEVMQRMSLFRGRGARVTADEPVQRGQAGS